MAQALAATCPPLQIEDVVRAADRLGEHRGTPGVVMVDRLFQIDVDRVNLRNLIEVLHVLHSLRADSLPMRSGEGGDERQ